MEMFNNYSFKNVNCKLTMCKPRKIAKYADFYEKEVWHGKFPYAWICPDQQNSDVSASSSFAEFLVLGAQYFLERYKRKVALFNVVVKRQ